MESVREMFDEMSLNVTAFLEEHRGVSKLNFAERGPVTGVDLSAWESKSSGCALPEDLKALLQITDGLTLKWDANLHDETIQLGCMNLNRLTAVTEIPLDVENDAAWGEVLMGQGEVLAKPPATLAEATKEQLEEWRQLRSKFKAFDLDKTCASGRVALLYVAGPQNPQVWFQDLAGQWFFIARCFTDYFRLLVMHLGLPNWHYAFTEQGLDQNCKHWLRFLSAERLAIDTDHHTNLLHRRRLFRGEPVRLRRTLQSPGTPAQNRGLSKPGHGVGRGVGGGGAGGGDDKTAGGDGGSRTRPSLDLETLDKSALLQSKSSSSSTKNGSVSKKKPSQGSGAGGVGDGWAKRAGEGPPVGSRPATAAPSSAASRAKRPTSATVRQ